MFKNSILSAAFGAALILASSLVSAGLIESGTSDVGIETGIPVGFGSIVIANDAVVIICVDGAARDLFLELEPSASVLGTALLQNGGNIMEFAVVSVDPKVAKNSYEISETFSISQGDFDLDGTITLADQDMLLPSWGAFVLPFTDTDASGDGFVGGDDLDVVRKNLNKTIEALIPEPSAFVGVLLLAGSLVIRRRSR